jgi:hypothetical protein
MSIAKKASVIWLVGLLLLSACGTPYKLPATSVVTSSPTLQAAVQIFPTSTPTLQATVHITPTSTPMLTLVTNSAEEFLVLNTIPKIASSETFYIAFSTIKNKEYLNSGPSIRTNDIRQCWYYADRTLRDCDPSSLSQQEFKEVERVFFAVGSFDSDKVLFVVDDYPYFISQAEIDAEGISENIKGYRVLLVRADGRWEEKSLVRIRLWLAP